MAKKIQETSKESGDTSNEGSLGKLSEKNENFEIKILEKDYTTLKEKTEKLEKRLDSAKIDVMQTKLETLENKEFADKDELEKAEKRLEKQIDEIKSNKKFWLGLFIGAILTIGVQIIAPFAKQQLGINEQPKNLPQIPSPKTTK